MSKNRVSKMLRKKGQKLGQDKKTPHLYTTISKVLKSISQKLNLTKISGIHENDDRMTKKLIKPLSISPTTL